MSLFSTQLFRGSLALPMLVLFGALALFANEAADAQPQAPAAPALVEVVEPMACGSLPGPTLPLSLVPADLGPIAQRRARIVAVRMAAMPSCRA